MSKMLTDPDSQWWSTLKRIINQHAVLRGDFTLTSGRRSNILFQMRNVTMHNEGAQTIGLIISCWMIANKLNYIGGMEVGAIPIVTATTNVAYFNLQHNIIRRYRQSGDYYPEIHGFFTRKQAKAHGAKESINGYYPNIKDQDVKEVVLVDDVATTGGSILKTLDVLLTIPDYKGRVSRAITLIDREEGATEALADVGITLYSIFKKSDFL